MSADLHLHVIHDDDNATGAMAWDKLPNIWIGSVSWLKATLFDEPDTFVPATVRRIFELVGEIDDQLLPRIDDELEREILKAFELPNATSYALADVNDVRKFLAAHRGLRVFSISW